MQIELTWQTITTAGAVITAGTVIAAAVSRIVRWVDRQKTQDKDILSVQQKHKTDVDTLRDEHNAAIRDINQELELLTYGILACLKGQREQGCNGPVCDAIEKIETHLNKKAHN